MIWLKQLTDKYLGGWDGSSDVDDILEYDSLTGQWKEVDKMIQGRSHHAVSVAEYSELAQYCNWVVSRYSRVLSCINW